MATVTVKQIEHPDGQKGPDGKERGIKYVGSKEYFTPKLGRDGKLKTGLDENSVDVLSIEDTQIKKGEQTKIRKLRDELEKLLGVSLAVDSPFWNDFSIVIEEDLPLDLSNALDRVKERVLVANRFVAPNKETISEDENFFNCNFYFYREDEELSKSVQKSIKEDKARSKLLNLYDSNVTHLRIVAEYLLGYTTDNMTPDHLYEKLKEYIGVANKTNLDAFMQAVAKSPEELMVKVILDKAINKRIVTSRNKIYRRGDHVLGNSYEEALTYLSATENSSELSSLKKEVERK